MESLPAAKWGGGMTQLLSALRFRRDGTFHLAFYSPLYR
jgi:hypothetical protein